MAQRKGGYQGTFNRCERTGCGCIAAKWSVYSDRMLCNNCLSFERAVALEREQAAMDADSRDAYETRRDALDMAVQ